MNNIKHIYWFAYYGEKSPSVRYRAGYPLAYFQKKYRISNHLVIPGYSFSRIVFFMVAYSSALFFRKRKSIIVIQRVQSKFIYGSLLKVLLFFRTKNTIYDIDDADYLNGNEKEINYFASRCEKLAAGSRALKKYFDPINAKTKVITSPVIDLNIYKFIKSKEFTIGWVGGFSWGHKDSLWDYLLNTIIELDFAIKLVLLGVDRMEDQQEIKSFLKDYSHIKLEIINDINWLNEKKIQDEIVKFDVGIATLKNEPYQLAKSGIKAKQYMCCGIPVVSVDLPENNNFVIDGHNGFLCDSPQEFKECINRFYEMDSREYREFAINARNSIVAFNHTQYLSQYRKLVRS